MKWAIVKSRLFLGIAVTGLCLSHGPSAARADVMVYQETNQENNFAPDTTDGTPNRPTGNQMGNTITLSGTARYLNNAIIGMASNSSNLTTETFTLFLYNNDGATDPGGSGILQPGTLIGSSTVQDTNFTGGANESFDFPSLLVPDHFTWIISSSPTGVPFETSTNGPWIGPFTTSAAPQAGSSADTVWFGTGDSGAWTTDSGWVIADSGTGTTTNFLEATFNASDIPAPEPAGVALLGLCAVGLLARRRCPQRHSH